MNNLIANVSVFEMVAAILALLVVLSLWNLVLSLRLCAYRRREQCRMSAVSRAGEAATADASAQMLGKLATIQTQLDDLCQQQRRLRGAAAGERSYELAQRLVRQGATAEQLVDACGLSRQEAELMCHVHGGLHAEH